MASFNPVSITFASYAEAIAYKRQNGGWIFLPDTGDSAMWFDASRVTPSSIMLEFAQGLSGSIQ